MRTDYWLKDEIFVAELPFSFFDFVTTFTDFRLSWIGFEHNFRFGLHSTRLVQSPLKQVAVFYPDTDSQVFIDVVVCDPTLDVNAVPNKIFP